MIRRLFLFTAIGAASLLSSSRAPTVYGQDVTVSSKVRSAIQPFIDRRVLAGAVTLVGTPDQVISLDAFGWLDIEGKEPMRTDAMFWIASQSKPIAGTALMILVDEGKIAVDDPVTKYLPDFADQWVVDEADENHQLLKRPQQPILVRHLLSHTSGLPKATLLMKPTLDLVPLAQVVAGNAMLPLESEPGAKYNYSNPGINTVGRLVEVVSGQSFEDFLQTRLFDPLGMRDTTFWPNEEQIARLAKSYRLTGDKQGLEATPVAQLHYPLNDRNKRHAFPGGGLFSTAADLFRFYRMLANGGILDGKRILSSQSLGEMTRDQTGSLKAGYGFGFKIEENAFGHGGAYGTNSAFHPREQLITIFLVQHASWAPEGKTILPAFRKAATESVP